jgi:hypothetical protein
MKFYRISLTEVRQLTDADQALMIEAILYEGTSSSSTLTFATEDEYLKWKSSRP